MNEIRLIGRLDIKNDHVIKGIQFEGLRKIGSPLEISTKYYQDGIDELIFIDTVASLYGRNNLFNIIEKSCEEIFIPITIGGGIRCLEDIKMALNSGADKVAINSAAIRNESLITEASKAYGSQAIVGSIEAKQKGNTWEVYIDNGREPTDINVIDWAKRLENLGAGEILITSIDNDGTKQGFDIELMKMINKEISIPVICSGGCGSIKHIDNLIDECGRVDAISIGSMFHYEIKAIESVKKKLKKPLKSSKL